MGCFEIPPATLLSARSLEDVYVTVQVLPTADGAAMAPPRTFLPEGMSMATFPYLTGTDGRAFNLAQFLANDREQYNCVLTSLRYDEDRAVETHTRLSPLDDAAYYAAIEELPPAEALNYNIYRTISVMANLREQGNTDRNQDVISADEIESYFWADYSNDEATFFRLGGDAIARIHAFVGLGNYLMSDRATASAVEETNPEPEEVAETPEVPDAGEPLPPSHEDREPTPTHVEPEGRGLWASLGAFLTAPVEAWTLMIPLAVGLLAGFAAGRKRPNSETKNSGPGGPPLPKAPPSVERAALKSAKQAATAVRFFIGTDPGQGGLSLANFAPDIRSILATREVEIDALGTVYKASIRNTTPGFVKLLSGEGFKSLAAGNDWTTLQPGDAFILGDVVRVVFSGTPTDPKNPATAFTTERYTPPAGPKDGSEKDKNSRSDRGAQQDSGDEESQRETPVPAAADDDDDLAFD